MGCRLHNLSVPSLSAGGKSLIFCIVSEKKENIMYSECKISGLCCEFLNNPIGIDETIPRLSWKINDLRQGARQTAYQVVAASSIQKLSAKPDLWDSGMVSSDQSLDVIYGGKKLKSRQQVFWQVRVRDYKGEWTDWSERASFEIGLLKSADWQAEWISHDFPKLTPANESCPFMRNEFEVKTGLVKARAYVTARGLFELHLNGKRVGCDHFTPGWTDYHKRIQYLTYDVQSLLVEGKNAAGAILGTGWYAGGLLWYNGRHFYGDQMSVLMQLELEYSDGSSQTVVTSPDWKTTTGPILMSEIYHGETYDARREMTGWSESRFDDVAWPKAKVVDAPKVPLVSIRSTPVRKQEELTVVGLTEPVFGVHVFELTQNMVGWARIKIRGKAGQEVVVRYSEMLKDDGTLYLDNLRTAKCTDRYICKGDGEEIFEPHFTFHGFRYIEITGLCEKPQMADVTGIVLHSGIDPTGVFECSEPLVNKLQSCILWGQKGNFFEVPTDCPQRDERLGWTGDAQVFIRTACFNRDVAAFFTKWCIDLEDSQDEAGAFPHVAPDVLCNVKGLKEEVGCAAWADAGVICPWTIYLCYGDKRILERHYKSMTKWIEWRVKNSKNLICEKSIFGDWLAIDISQGDPGRSPTPRDLIATAYFAYTTEIVSKVAGILGHTADKKRYCDLHKKVKITFQKEFISPNGRVAGDTQTAYLLALGFDLVPVKQQKHAVERLVREIEVRGTQLSTGFVGTPLLAPVLTKFGRADLAYKLLLTQTYPSWIYPILQGGTTMWERWNSYTKDKGFGNANMNSFNHYAYGAIGEWMYNTVAGIELDPNKPGYKNIIIKPQPGEGITWARAELVSRYGLIVCSWKLDGKKLSVNGVIPPNTTATVILPGKKPKSIQSGKFEFESVQNPASLTF